MASKAFSQNEFLIPRAKSEELAPLESPHRQRRATVYDAVAGRISSSGFIPKDLKYPSTRDTTSSSVRAVPPEAVLFRSKNAPARYSEFDIYFANERDLRSGDLPDSDMLKALHCYMSDFYSACPDGGADDFRSFDETALIAFGILMEEAAREMLGETGDLALTEGEHIESSAIGNRSSTSRGSSQSKVERVTKKRRVAAKSDRD